ncbi:hypothetical protein BLNAU_15069 [Blattamonas nauphoetae]|uniref:Uncharacterized protein n=1 Tax=Blattamonas nauphoetae TaxID=2049346 RepID=A0ABQ9XGQ7_9EUKA|nr:hypothetical protein BLNAU_15069 [Blattamonas nauphoetae]
MYQIKSSLMNMQKYKPSEIAFIEETLDRDWFHAINSMLLKNIQSDMAMFKTLITILRAYLPEIPSNESTLKQDCTILKQSLEFRLPSALFGDSTPPQQSNPPPGNSSLFAPIPPQGPKQPAILQFSSDEPPPQPKSGLLFGGGSQPQDMIQPPQNQPQLFSSQTGGRPLQNFQYNYDDSMSVYSDAFGGDTAPPHQAQYLSQSYMVSAKHQPNESNSLSQTYAGAPMNKLTSLLPPESPPQSPTYSVDPRQPADFGKDLPDTPPRTAYNSLADPTPTAIQSPQHNRQLPQNMAHTQNHLPSLHEPCLQYSPTQSIMTINDPIKFRPIPH